MVDSNHKAYRKRELFRSPCRRKQRSVHHGLIYGLSYWLSLIERRMTLKRKKFCFSAQFIITLHFTDYVPFKSLLQYDFFSMFFSYAHQGCIYLHLFAYYLHLFYISKQSCIIIPTMVKLIFQHHYSSLQRHMILQK